MKTVPVIIEVYNHFEFVEQMKKIIDTSKPIVVRINTPGGYCEDKREAFKKALSLNKHPIMIFDDADDCKIELISCALPSAGSIGSGFPAPVLSPPVERLVYKSSQVIMIESSVKKICTLNN